MPSEIFLTLKKKIKKKKKHADEKKSCEYGKEVDKDTSGKKMCAEDEYEQQSVTMSYQIKR